MENLPGPVAAFANGDRQLLLVNFAGGVSVVDTASRTATASVLPGPSVPGIEVGVDSRTISAGVEWFIRDAPTGEQLVGVEISSGTLLTQVELQHGGQWATIAPASGTAWVGANEYDSAGTIHAYLDVIDLESGAIRREVELTQTIHDLAPFGEDGAVVLTGDGPHTVTATTVDADGAVQPSDSISLGSRWYGEGSLQAADGGLWFAVSDDDPLETHIGLGDSGAVVTADIRTGATSDVFTSELFMPRRFLRTSTSLFVTGVIGSTSAGNPPPIGSGQFAAVDLMNGETYASFQFSGIPGLPAIVGEELWIPVSGGAQENDQTIPSTGSLHAYSLESSTSPADTTSSPPAADCPTPVGSHPLLAPGYLPQVGAVNSVAEMPAVMPDVIIGALCREGKIVGYAAFVAGSDGYELDAASVAATPEEFCGLLSPDYKPYSPLGC
ncbi:MAG: hypothetical protein ABMA25_15005 [Ilumatobacteraceae bacterium]